MFAAHLQGKGVRGMLKGVHHRIVEIRQTEDPYFERALLFVRAECAEDADVDWQGCGRTFLQRATPHTGLRRARWQARLRAALFMVSGAIFGVLIGVFSTQIR